MKEAKAEAVVALATAGGTGKAGDTANVTEVKRAEAVVFTVTEKVATRRIESVEGVDGGCSRKGRLESE